MGFWNWQIGHFYPSVGKIAIFSDTLERNIVYSDTLDFRRDGMEEVFFVVLQIFDSNSQC